MIDQMNWDLLREEPVMVAREIAVSGLVRELGRLVEADDLFQDAAIIIASHPEKVRAYLADAEHPSHLVRWIWSRLRDKIRPELRRAPPRPCR
ncbi:hypothetical protein ACQPYE_08355 [Actinosynnema sp. CA-299493]